MVVGIVWILLGVGVGAVLSAAKQAHQIVGIVAAPAADLKAASKVLAPQARGKAQTILLIGTDKRPTETDRGRSDTIILVRVDPDNQYISMLSLPRDLYVNIPGYGMDKINAAYSKPGPSGGPALAIKTVTEVTGAPINDYIVVSFQGFVKLVNEVGGVYLDIDRRYHHRNMPGDCPNTPNCYSEIDLQPGYQLLDGSDALAYARFRHLDSDFSRIARQQMFLSELKRQVKAGGVGDIFELGAFKRKVLPNVSTSIGSATRFLGLLKTAIEVDKSRIARVFVHGHPAMTPAGESIVVANPGEIQQAVRQWENPSFQHASSTAKPVRPADVRVAVFNGSGRVAGAEQVAAALSARGYDAYAAGNWKRHSTRQGSSVFYAPDRRAAGLQVQALLGPTTGVAVRTRGEVNALNRGSDVTVVTGAGSAGLAPRAPRKPMRQTASVVPTLSLGPTLRSAQRAAPGMRLLLPTRVASESRVRVVRPYAVRTRGATRYPALRIVLEQGYHQYWGIEEMRWRNPPIIEGRTGTIQRCGRTFSTFYDGKNMIRLLWQDGPMTYWVSNGLPGLRDYPLSPETIYAVACSMRRVSRARLPKGVSGQSIPVQLDAPTP